ncbi:hypothetical protein Q2T40_12435 [Winogradskyella maritima]|uniref:Uncharacterized protein n=1 Tax=Winogradskyella maritima TaxID=1517766 RepID=A0ABV8AHA4_9FLAO|nr:hypothetical protein [Winogradskyella maritima]
MRKLAFFPFLLVCFLCLSLTAPEIGLDNKQVVGFLPANCNEPVHFRIDSQEPCAILNVNPDTGELFRRKKISGLCGNYNDSESTTVSINYTVTNYDGVTQGNFIIIDLEEEE